MLSFTWEFLKEHTIFQREHAPEPIFLFGNVRTVIKCIFFCSGLTGKNRCAYILLSSPREQAEYLALPSPSSHFLFKAVPSFSLLFQFSFAFSLSSSQIEQKIKKEKKKRNKIRVKVWDRLLASVLS